MASSWLQKQRKGDLIELCELVGLTSYNGLKKSEIEALLEAFLIEHETACRLEAAVSGFYAARDRALSSPVKRELEPVGSAARSVRRRPILAPPPPSPPRRRVTNVNIMERDFVPSSSRRRNGIKLELGAEEPDTDINTDADDGEPATEPWRGSTDVESTPREQSQQLQARTPSPEAATATGAALAATPRQATPAAAIPASPAALAQAVDNEVIALRARFSDLVRRSGVSDHAAALRSALSTVHSVLLVVSSYELWQLRPALLPAKHAFTVPAQPRLGLSADVPVSLPDVFLLLTAAFWTPFLTWALTSFVAPTLAGYFFNMTSNPNRHAPVVVDPASGRKTVVGQPRYAVDPLTFSVVKAVLSYVVYARGVTFQDWLSEHAVDKLVGALYGGTTGILVGTAVTGLMSIYDAILRQ